MPDHSIDLDRYQAKHAQTMLLAASYQRLGMPDRAAVTLNCGTQLGFAEVEGVTHLVEANFCRGRLCPLCSWRRSLKIYSATSQILDYLDAQHGKTIKYLFLTLTVRNVTGEQLGETIDAMAAAYNRLRANRAWKTRVKGAMRTLEITYNRETDTYHPHYHLILAVPSDYGRKGDKLYWSQEEWAAVWAKAARLDYTPIICIERVRGRRSGIAEVSKYAVKDTDYIRPGDPATTDKVVQVLMDHLSGRRLISYTGILREAQRALKIEDPETAELTDTIRGDITCVVTRYRWSAGLGCYRPDGTDTITPRHR